MNDAITLVEEASAILSSLPKVLETLVENWNFDRVELTSEDIDNIALQSGSIAAMIKTVETCIITAEEKLDKAAVIIPTDVKGA